MNGTFKLIDGGDMKIKAQGCAGFKTLSVSAHWIPAGETANKLAWTPVIQETSIPTNGNDEVSFNLGDMTWNSYAQRPGNIVPGEIGVIASGQNGQVVEDTLVIKLTDNNIMTLQLAGKISSQKPPPPAPIAPPILPPAGGTTPPPAGSGAQPPPPGPTPQPNPPAAPIPPLTPPAGGTPPPAGSPGGAPAGAPAGGGAQPPPPGPTPQPNPPTPQGPAPLNVPAALQPQAPRPRRDFFGSLRTGAARCRNWYGRHRRGVNAAFPWVIIALMALWIWWNFYQCPPSSATAPVMAVDTNTPVAFTAPANPGTNVVAAATNTAPALVGSNSLPAPAAQTALPDDVASLKQQFALVLAALKTPPAPMMTPENWENKIKIGTNNDVRGNNFGIVNGPMIIFNNGVNGSNSEKLQRDVDIKYSHSTHSSVTNVTSKVSVAPTLPPKPPGIAFPSEMGPKRCGQWVVPISPGEVLLYRMDKDWHLDFGADIWPPDLKVSVSTNGIGFIPYVGDTFDITAIKFEGTRPGTLYLHGSRYTGRH